MDNKVIQAYFKFKKDLNKQTRYDLIQRFGEYQLFDEILINKRNPKKGGLSINYGETPKQSFKANNKRLSEYCLIKGGYITGVYTPNNNFSNYGYGDVKNPKNKAITNDALLIIVNPNKAEVELFVCKNKRGIARQLHQMLCDGVLVNEINYYRNQN